MLFIMAGLIVYKSNVCIYSKKLYIVLNGGLFYIIEENNTSKTNIAPSCYVDCGWDGSPGGVKYRAPLQCELRC